MLALTLLPMFTEMFFRGSFAVIAISVSILGRVALLVLLAALLQWRLPGLAIAGAGALATLISGFARAALRPLVEDHQNPDMVLAVMSITTVLVAAALVTLTWLLRSAAEGGPLSAPELSEGQHVAQGQTSNDFLIGGGMLMPGGIVTAVSIASSHGTGGRYLVTTGLIGIGLGRLIRGMIRRTRAS